MHVGFGLESLMERAVGRCIVSMIILKLNVNKEPRKVWTGLIWLGMGNTGGFFEHCVEASIK